MTQTTEADKINDTSIRMPDETELTENTQSTTATSGQPLSKMEHINWLTVDI